jgi:hypothetical protein
LRDHASTSAGAAVKMTCGSVPDASS